MRLNGGLLIGLGAGLGLVVSIYNYFASPSLLAPVSDISYSPGALVAIAATFVLFLAGLVLGGRPRSPALTTFLVLGSLVGIAGVALAALLLESRILLALMLVCAIGWLIRALSSTRSA